MSDIYQPPLDRLLTLGEDAARADEWPDYLAMGLAAEHVPLLVRMATDRRLRGADDPELWAPIHAWRTLGQLRAADAVEPLTSLLQEAEEWDWVSEELPEVFALIGPTAIPALVRSLDQRARGPMARIVAADALKRIAESHPDARDASVAALVAQLGHFTTQDRTLNGFLVADLLDLDAAGAAPVMEQAFAAGRVDISIAGDWEDVQVALGLLPARRTARPNYMAEEGMDLGALRAPLPPRAPTRGRERRRMAAKRRRKLARQSRRRNWRRK